MTMREESQWLRKSKLIATRIFRTKVLLATEDKGQVKIESTRFRRQPTIIRERTGLLSL
jgi:hypothetical protein